MTSSRARLAVILLIGFYFPFLFSVIGGMAYITYCLGEWAVSVHILLAAPACFVGIMTLALLVALLAFFAKDDFDDPMELTLPKRATKGLKNLVQKVAGRQDLPMPDEIRLHVVSLAHVYEHDGQRILVIGGAALASLSPKALAGVIAHELGHFAAGDTAFSRTAQRWHRTMMHVEIAMVEMPWNPLGWIFRAWHLVYRLAWAADQRQREYIADQEEVELVGPEKAASTLIAICSIDEMPFSRLSSVAEWYAMMPTANSSIFTEQVRRGRQTTPDDWQNACRKALKKETGCFDSHPCLLERLEAMGVSRKKAVKLAAKLQPGDTDPAHLIAGWEEIDICMSGFLINIFREMQQNKRDFASIVLGSRV